MASTTFVTAYYPVFETTNQYAKEKTPEWRWQRFFELADQCLPMVLFCAPEESITFTEKYPHIHVVKMPLADMWTSSFLRAIEENTNIQIRLPKHRNEMKDTREFLTLMNTKPDFMASAIEINPWKTALFAWVDFNITSIFSDPIEVFSCMAQQEPTLSGMHIPGCQASIVGKNDITQICAKSIQWRFVGGFFIGKPDAILHWIHQIYRPGFMVYMAESDYTLTWEVNVWAWLEARYVTDWKPEWYSANHNDTIIRIPILGSDAHTVLCNNTKNNESWSYASDPCFQSLPGFHATTPSYVYHPILDRHYLVIRYVNYWITHTGSYIYSQETCPEGSSHVIITKNLVYELDGSTQLRTFSRFIGEMNNNTVGLLHRPSFSEGLEDLRLAWNANKQCIRFVATTSCYVPNGKSRIMVGDFDPENLSYGHSSCIILQSPGGKDVWCEKNWVPISIPFAGNLEVFVYKWTPHIEFVVPIRISDTDADLASTSILVKSTGALDILKSCGASNIWRRDGGMRGSSVPVFSKRADQWFVVVHASDDTSPRRYFHRFIALHKDTYLPVRMSSPFSFIRVGIEFCIGLAVMETTDEEKENKESFICWFSQMDRDPMAMAISMDDLVWTTDVEN